MNIYLKEKCNIILRQCSDIPSRTLQNTYIYIQKKKKNGNVRHTHTGLYMNKIILLGWHLSYFFFFLTKQKTQI